MIELNGKCLCESCFCDMPEGAFCPECGYNANVTVVDPTMLKPGSILLGKYVVGKMIGKGGFGVTYMAYDVTTRKKVAIKEYFPYGVALRSPGVTTVSVSSMDNADAFKLGAEKFYNEAKMVSRFNGNPNIVGVHEFFYENDTVYFVMEYLKGHTLKEHIKEKGVLTPAQALFIANNVSNALMAAHSANVLHRDISPDNIILCDNGNVTLIDFGAARQVVAEHSQSFSVILKPGFAPLEQYQKKGNQGPWTDIYSLGTTIYHALTGDIPEDPMSRIDSDEEFSSNIYNIEPEIWAVIKKATQLKIENRYADVFVLRNDLSHISYQPEPVIVPVEDPNDKMPEFKTAVPFGMTQAQTVTAPQSVSVQPATVPQAASFPQTVAATQPASAPQAASFPQTVAATPPASVPQAVAIPQTVAEITENTEPAANSAEQHIPVQKKKFNYSEFFKMDLKDFKHSKVISVCAIALAITIVIGFLIVPSLLKSDNNSEPTGVIDFDFNYSNYTTSKVDDDSNKHESIKAMNTLAKQINDIVDNALIKYTTGEERITQFTRHLFFINISRDGEWKLYTTHEHKTKDYIFEEIKDIFPDLKDRDMYIVTKGTKCVFVACHDSGHNIVFESEANKLIDAQGNPKTSYEWNGETAGITESGLVIGTYPAIGLEGSSDGASDEKSKATTTKGEIVVETEPDTSPSAEVMMEIKDANSIAKKIQSTFSGKLQTQTLNGFGRKTLTYETIRIEVDKDGYWSVSGIDPKNYESVKAQGHNWKWEASASGIKADSGQSDNQTANMLRYLAECYPDLRSCSMCLIIDMSCRFIAFSQDITDAERLQEIVEDMDINCSSVNNEYKWNGNTAGITEDGIVIGTYPTVDLS